MVIREETPISMAEVAALVGDNERGVAMKKFIGNFVKMDVEKAKELKGELEALDLIKLKASHIVKIVDFLPKDAVELNKVVGEASLDSEEVAKVLDVVGKY